MQRHRTTHCEPDRPALVARGERSDGRDGTEDGAEIVDRDETDDAGGERRWRCATCATVIAASRDLFRLGGHEPVQIHTNPAGLIFRVGTFRDARHLAPRGATSTVFTWFPGYAWQIVVCATCQTHLGWHFRGDGEPPAFYGLLVERMVEGEA